ncbi:hypothetical protein BU25DRAFT_199781 [Macroventuria anomochaeta]|uniref:Uncharacterized protein n=1 Tax=Macroventuria anomochaeta TaxID=301207 RepID=A0ACB6RQ01_9PLEO|nr:uncharacterized protein BU25DRAFT_199781 [Macroventuria anomochaeta]KAF2622989.1 hypothetical protein BU25DRAFT_199781 [Macroventuria anomochaeta]
MQATNHQPLLLVVCTSGTTCTRRHCTNSPDRQHTLVQHIARGLSLLRVTRAPTEQLTVWSMWGQAHTTIVAATTKSDGPRCAARCQLFWGRRYALH